MVLSDIKIRAIGMAFEAELRGDYTTGDRGYSVVIAGCGATKDTARGQITDALNAMGLDMDMLREVGG
jgi:hypothetical protein